MRDPGAARHVERNPEDPADRGVEFPIGVNLGDVIIDGDDIDGVNVNVATRLEALAEPNRDLGEPGGA